MKEKQDKIKQIVESVNKGKKFPAVDLVSDNPQMAAVMSKLVAAKTHEKFDTEAKHQQRNLDQNQVINISEDIKNRIAVNENILQLFPDIELAIQILVSSILSPKDMVQTELLYKVSEPILPSELTLKLLDIVKKEINKTYKIEDELPTILRHMLFDTGSYIKVILPESIVDEVINDNKAPSLEAIGEILDSDGSSSSLGILGNPGKRNSSVSVESLFQNRNLTMKKLTIQDDNNNVSELPDSFLEITDNFKLLKLPKVIEASNKVKLNNIIRPGFGVSKENYDIRKYSNKQMENLVYKNTSTEYRSFLVLPKPSNAFRKSVGRPLVLNPPSEAVIPVHVPGDEKNHIGYFILVDLDGNPVTLHGEQNALGLISSINQNNAPNQSLATSLIKKAKNNLINNSNPPSLDNISRIYAGIVEKDLMDRLKNGLYGNDVEISNNSEIYRIMLARALSAKFTRLVYVPAELATYFAFKHHPNGVGKSLLDDLKALTSMRAIILFAKVMAIAKSSISLTHVNMTLDPHDPDPQKTIEEAADEIIKMRQQYFPLGINSPNDLTDWIQRAGFEFTFEGHPGLPQTKFEFESRNIQRDIPDDSLDELLRKQTYMAMGLSPETVDNGLNSEFATTAVMNNVLLQKRVMQDQGIFCNQLTDYTKKILSSDNNIFMRLLEVVRSSKESLVTVLSDEEKIALTENEVEFCRDVVCRFVDVVELDLPKPDTSTVESQSEAYNAYSDALEKALDAWIGSDIIPEDLAGSLNRNIDSVKAAIKAYMLRQWMSNNGYMNELSDITSVNEEGKPALDIYEISGAHIEGLLTNCLEFIKNLDGKKKESDEKLKQFDLVESDISADSSSSDSGSDDTGGDDFNMDDFGSEDTGGEDNTSEGEEATDGEEDATDDTEPTEEDVQDDLTDEDNTTEEEK